MRIQPEMPTERPKTSKYIVRINYLTQADEIYLSKKDLTLYLLKAKDVFDNYSGKDIRNVMQKIIEDIEDIGK